MRRARNAYPLGALPIALGLFASAASLAAQDAPAAPPHDPFILMERSDFSRYVDGKYIGHAYRESRGSLSPVAGEQGYKGEFLVLEETMHDMRSVARRVDRAVPVSLSIGRWGSLDVQEDSGYPGLRGMPSMPEGSPPQRIGQLQPGATWNAPGIRALDFDGSGSFILMPFMAEYRFLGPTTYRGGKALSLSARFATRWKADIGDAAPSSASSVVKSATGTHSLDIVLDAGTNSPLFIRDRFDETFALAGGDVSGSSERRSGFSLYFFEGSVPLDRKAAGAAIVAAIRDKEESRPPVAAPPPVAAEALPPGAGPGPLIAGEGPQLADNGELGAAGIELDTSPEGMVLRVKDLRFVADSDVILSGELWRLDAIAAALKAIPGRSFLVAGHSAAVGKAEGELELSIRRAKRVADELAARGIEPSRLLYRGYGSSRPLAPNDTEEGRAKNRRVEITILD